MDENIPDPDGTSERRIAFNGPPPMVIDPGRSYTAELVTSSGTMTVALDAVGAPATVNNFVFLDRKSTRLNSSHT